MRKIFSIVLLFPFAAAISFAGPPGGGHSSGGHSSGGHAGPVFSGAPNSGARGFGSRPGSGIPLTGPAPLGATGPAPVNATGSLRPVYGQSGGNHRPGIGDRKGGRNPYGYFPGPFVLPVYGYDGFGNGYYDSSDYGPASDPGYGPGNGYDDPQAAAANQDMLGQQVQRLTAEVQDMRSQQAQPQPAASGVVPTAAKPDDSDAQNDVPVTLVLQSGQQVQVKNYAVTNGVFWNFSKHPAQKIPVSSINIGASEKATAANGGDFPPIGQ